MAHPLEQFFPNLHPTEWEKTSEKSDDYNCIAHAFNDTTRWWSPQKGYYWPDDEERNETIESYSRALAKLRCERCQDGTIENGFEKFAIYTREDGTPSHMALQLADGRWSSKIAELEDIAHNHLDALSGTPTASSPSPWMPYGQVAAFLKRSVI